MRPPHIVVVRRHSSRSTRHAEVCCTYWRADSEVCTYWRAAASEGILPSPHQLLHSWLSLMTRQKRRLFAFLCQCVMTVKKNSHIIFNWESVSLLFCLMTVGENLTSWFSTETYHTLWQVIITTGHILIVTRLYVSAQRSWHSHWECACLSCLQNEDFMTNLFGGSGNSSHLSSAQFVASPLVLFKGYNSPAADKEMTSTC